MSRHKCLSVFCSWVTPSGVFQAYITYAQNGYLAHLAWASAWMCKYTPTACATADKYWNAAASSTLQYSLGYDWDATLPGAAVLMLSMNRNVNSARNYLEGTVLAKWEVRELQFSICHVSVNICFITSLSRDTASSVARHLQILRCCSNSCVRSRDWRCGVLYDQNYLCRVGKLLLAL